MYVIQTLLLSVLVAFAAVPPPAASETFDGTLVCAKCTLKRADAKECQDVLLVPSADAPKKEYYIAKNDVAKGAGEACTAAVKAKVTGTVAEKDGRTWLTPSKIEKQ